MKHKGWVLLALLALGAAGLRLIGLGVPELWYDESFTWLASRLPLAKRLLATAGDTHPPGYYVLMGAWARLIPADEFYFRLPSVLFSLAGLVVFWFLVRDLDIPQPARIAALLLMAVSPFQIAFAQEARMYTELQFFVLLGTLAVMRREWLLLFGCNLVLLYLHNYGLIYVFVLALLALANIARYGAIDRKPAALAFIGAGLLWLPWFAVLLGQMHTVSGGYWIEPLNPAQIIYTAEIMLFGIFTRQYVMAGVLLVVCILAWSTAANIKDAPGWVVPVSMMMVVPVLLVVGVSLFWRPVYLWRGLIGCAPFVYIWMVTPLANLPGPRRWLAAGILAPMLVIGLFGYWLDVYGYKSTTLSSVNIVREFWEDGDIVYATSDGPWVNWSAYFEHPIYLMPACADDNRGALTQITRQALGAQISELDNIPHSRAWVLVMDGPVNSLCNMDRVSSIIGTADPFYLVGQNDYLTSGIWLIENETLAGTK